MRHFVKRAAVAALTFALAPLALAADPAGAESPGAAPADVRTAQPAVRAPLPESLREGPVLYALPDGWRRAADVAAEKNFFRIAPKDLPAGKTFVVRVSMGDPTEGKTLEKAATDDAATLAKGQLRHEHTPVTALRTAKGYDAVAVLHHRTSILRQEEYWQIIYLRAGDRHYVLAVQTDDKELIVKHAPALQAVLDGLQYAPVIELAPAKDGARALTLQDVYDISDFFEWLLDVPMTPVQRTAIRDLLVDVWSVDPKAGVAALEQAEGLRKNIDAMKPEEREALRQAAGPQFAAKFREGGGIFTTFADLYDAGHKPLVAGGPPLTRQAADANLELVYFMANHVAGTHGVGPTKEQKDKWAAELAGKFAQMSAEERRNIAMMPIVWAGTSAEWPSVGQTDRDAKKAEWAKIPTVKEVADGLTKAREEAAKLAAAANTGKAGGHDPIAFAKAYKDMQTQQMQTAMISNMMRMQHQSNMTIIRNMGSQQYQYKYVYRHR